MSDRTEMIGLMGYSLAKDRGQVKKGVELCTKAIQMERMKMEQELRQYGSASWKDIQNIAQMM